MSTIAFQLFGFDMHQDITGETEWGGEVGQVFYYGYFNHILVN